MTPNTPSTTPDTPSTTRSVVRKTTLDAQGDDREYYASLTPEQRIAMVWPLTLAAWRFADPDGFEYRFSRHVVRCSTLTDC